MRDQAPRIVYQQHATGLADAACRDDVPDQLEIDVRDHAALAGGGAAEMDGDIGLRAVLKIDGADMAPLLPRGQIGIRPAEIRARGRDVRP